MKKRVYIWGAGKYLKLVYPILDMSKCEVKGIIDNNRTKQGTTWQGIDVTVPSVLAGNEFDYVLISPINYKEIVLQCVKMGLPADKVIVFCDDESCSKVDIFLSPLKMANQIEKYHKHINNMPYELEIENIPKIKSAEELLDLVIKYKYSISRFGDGEFELMLNRGRPWFQEPDSKLAMRLKEILTSDNKKVIVTIPRNFGCLDVYKDNAAEGIREYMSADIRADIMRYIDLDKVYYDAYVSRPYIIYKDKNRAAKIFTLFKKIFEERNIIIVEGRFSKFGVLNDLFSGCKSIRRVECPSKNAWDRYDEIISCIKSNYQEGDLVCISLGPTATVLAYDLGILGIQSIDIGHLDNEYEWFLKKVDERVNISGKLVAELKFSLDNDEIVDELKDEQYEKQIIAYIGC